MIKRKLVKHCRQLPLAVLGQELIYCSKVFHIGTSGSVLVYQKNQRL